jgi:hypothetical protein
MQQYTTVVPYIVPMTMGDQATTGQIVYRQADTTAQPMVVPFRVVSLQRDLDRHSEASPRRNLSLSDFAKLFEGSKLHENESHPKKDDEEKVTIDSERVLSPERAFLEWQQMTKPADVGIQLPCDVED